MQRDVVALLTRNSIDRPWILYEAGVAKGQLNTIVFGVAIGVPLERASTGPFAQFQNCADDEDSLTKLVLELIGRNLPEAAPREAAILREVTPFRATVEELLKGRSVVKVSASPPVDETAVAKLFEEVKVMVRDLPEAIQGNLRPRGLRRFHPMMMEELLFHPALRDAPNGRALSWLAAITAFREDFPWLYEVGIELYRALQANDESAVGRAAENVQLVAEAFAHEPFADLMDSRDLLGTARYMPEILKHYFSEVVSPQRAARRRPARRTQAEPPQAEPRV